VTFNPPQTPHHFFALYTMATITTPATATTTVAPGAVTLHFAAVTNNLTKSTQEVHLDFRTVPAVVTILPLFSKVVLTRVTAFIQQIDLPASSEKYASHHLRFGLGYRTLDLTTNGANVTAVPHFEDCATSREGIQCTRTWGVGGAPFPPGIQLELKAKEDIAEYARFFLAQPAATLDGNLARAHVSFTLECSVGGYGV
jgi:hypothetical protein